MDTNLLKYYDGVLGNLRASVDQMNSLFAHQGVKGEGNEDQLIELLRKFLPKKYGVGSGVIVDREGKQSRQCDVVIFDEQNFPTLLSHTSVSMYPIDIVLATIEVKTTLDESAVSTAIRNLESMRELTIVEAEMTVPKSREDGSIAFVSHKANYPMGFIFSYNSRVKNSSTFRDWFCGKSQLELTCASLDMGIVQLNMGGGNVNAISFPLRRPDGIVVTNCQDNKALFEELVYPVKIFDGKHVLIDQTKILLSFLLHLSFELNNRVLNYNLDFAQHYFPDRLLNGFKIPD